ncbi:Pectin lyase fold/virulence factor [Pseudocohnilembus persalinus]|uniref:Pectin lyase fold/virulence factor n=1 Tax=Pseudocohnilembus persalinus TaxID=266149 RepID=A0A0V0R3U6_PSEPJ|nr:Pectin lyase fold/virulence factor [Pseudocohnilembus persalinus]|eukprot:KRX09153.1 Pectin lyase fold/virulence factor [Pseudocohnilembus persalinus]
MAPIYVDTVIKSYFTNTEFSENQVVSQSSGTKQAGVLSLYNGQDVYISGCSFVQNSVSNYYGGAINFNTFTGEIIINDSFFDQNVANGNGGAVRFYQCVDVEILDSTFTNNIVDSSNGLGGGLYFTTISGTITLTGINMESNTASQGGGLYLTNIKKLILDGESEFNNNQANEGGSLYILQFVELYIQDNNFNNNIAWTSQEIGNGGALFIDCYSNTQDTIIQILYNNFDGNTGINGGAIYLVSLSQCANEDDCQLKGNNLYNNYVTTNGGAILATTVDNINFYDNYFNNSVADPVTYSLGGALYLIEGTNIIFDNCTFSYGSASQGAAIYGEMCTSFEFQNCLFENNIGDGYGGALCMYSDYFLTINNTQFLNNQGEGSGAIEAWQVYDYYLYNLYFYNNTSTKGGVSYMDAVYRVDIINCTFEANSANNGGAFYISNSETFTFNNILAYNNSASFRGGAFYIQATQITFQNLTFDLNYAMTGGGFYIVESESITGDDMTFKNNYSVKKGGAFLGNQLQTSVFTNMLAENNTSESKEGGGFILIECIDMTLDTITSIDNSGKHGAGMHLDDITNLKFSNYIAYGNLAEQYGAGLSLYQIKYGEIFNFIIYDNNATINGGAAYIYQSSNLLCYNWHIYNNRANKIGGGAVFFDNNSENITMQSFKIENNLAQQFGGAFYMTNSQEATLQDMELIQNQGKSSGGQIYIANCIQTILDNVIFEYDSESEHENGIYYPQYGNSITATSGTEIQIKNCKFSNSVASLQGGTIYITDVDTVDIDQILVENSQIISENDDETTSLCGGAMYLKNVKSFILENSELNNNYAKYKGGGIYMYDVQQFDIQMNTFDKNQIYFDNSINLYYKDEDYLLTQGGAIYYQIANQLDTSEDIILILKSNIIKNSKASSGGGVFINKNIDVILSVTVQNMTLQENQGDIGPAMRFIGPISEKIQSNIKSKIDSGNIVLKDNKGYIYSDNIYFGYVDNEHLITSDTTEFSLCTEDKYLQDGGVVSCLPCSENIVCGGGYIPIFPNENYWRPNKQTYVDIYYCTNFPENCKGNDTCSEGYTGLLCEQCDRENNYQKFGDECLKCQKRGLQYFSIFMLFLFYILILSYYIYGVKKKVEKVTLSKWCNILFNIPFQNLSQISAIAKIFVMHCQILYITNPNFVNINFEFQFMLEIFGNPSFMFNPSLLCLFNDSNEKNLVYYLYIYGLFITLLALLCMVLIIFIFKMLKLVKDNKHLVMYIKMSFSCFFLIIQPGFIQSTLQFLQCREIAGQKYVSADLDTTCDSGFYKSLILPVNIIFLLLCTIFIPGYILYKLKKQRNNKMMYYHNFSKIYGIYFLEYNEKCYFWEFFTMTIKLIVVLLATLIQDQEKTIVKGLFILATLGYYSHYCLKLKPFLNKQLNDLSFFSINTQIMTILLLIFHNYLQRLDSRIKALETIIVIIVLLINFLFLYKMLVDIVRESKNEFRVIVLQFCKKHKILGKLVASIEKTLEKSKEAKRRWKKLKYGVFRYKTQYPSKSLYESINEPYMPFVKRVEQDKLLADQSHKSNIKQNNSQYQDSQRTPNMSHIEDSKMKLKSQFALSKDVNDISDSNERNSQRNNFFDLSIRRNYLFDKKEDINNEQEQTNKGNSLLIEFEKDLEELNQDFYQPNGIGHDLPLSMCYSGKWSERNMVSKRLDQKASDLSKRYSIHVQKDNKAISQKVSGQYKPQTQKNVKMRERKEKNDDNDIDSNSNKKSNDKMKISDDYDNFSINLPDNIDRVQPFIDNDSKIDFNSTAINSTNLQIREKIRSQKKSLAIKNQGDDNDQIKFQDF